MFYTLGIINKILFNNVDSHMIHCIIKLTILILTIIFCRDVIVKIFFYYSEYSSSYQHEFYLSRSLLECHHWCWNTHRCAWCNSFHICTKNMTGIFRKLFSLILLSDTYHQKILMIEYMIWIINIFACSLYD